MKIIELYMKNWKCFSEKKIRFSHMNIINERNGYGKTSMFQAIQFALFGNRSGYTFSSLKLIPDEETLIKIQLQGVDKLEIERRFHISSSSSLKVNDELVAQSSTMVNKYINNILPFDILKVLWSADTLKSSEILNPDFLIKNLFQWCFSAPLKLEKHYKHKLFFIQKDLKNYDGVNYKKEINEINKKINDIKMQLKNKSFSEELLLKAKNAANADKIIKEKNLAPLVSLEICNKYLNINKNLDILSIIEKEKNNIPPRILLSKKDIDYIRKESSLNCLICGEPWSKEKEDNLLKEMNTKSIDYALIEKLTSEYNILLMKNDIEISILYYKYLKELESCKNYQEIIENYDDKINKLWVEYENLQRKEKNLFQKQEGYKKYLELKNEQEKYKNILLFLKSYIEDASEYYLYEVTKRASVIMNKINCFYEQIILTDNEYKIGKLTGSFMDLISVHQLSSGEKSLLGLSLVLSTHELFFPEIPLLFDESFSALDSENIESLKKYFENSRPQIFIITHDRRWSE